MKANGFCEIYEYKDGTVTKKTSFNDAYTETHFISKAKHMPFVNKDGVTIDGWVLEPKDYDPSKELSGSVRDSRRPKMYIWRSIFAMRCRYGHQRAGLSFSVIREDPKGMARHLLI